MDAWDGKYKAPMGKFRVIGENSQEYLAGDSAELETAVNEAWRLIDNPATTAEIYNADGEGLPLIDAAEWWDRLDYAARISLIYKSGNPALLLASQFLGRKAFANLPGEAKIEVIEAYGIEHGRAKRPTEKWMSDDEASEQEMFAKLEQLKKKRQGLQDFDAGD